MRMARLDPFNTNSQAKPPDGELAQIEQGVSRSEGHAVIAADVGGQAAFPKKPFKYGESEVSLGRRKRLAGQQIPAGMIGDGERVAVWMIPRQELALVIGAPEFIGTLA